jgi:hypothetical protein
VRGGATVRLFEIGTGTMVLDVLTIAVRTHGLLVRGLFVAVSLCGLFDVCSTVWLVVCSFVWLLVVLELPITVRTLAPSRAGAARQRGDNRALQVAQDEGVCGHGHGTRIVNKLKVKPIGRQLALTNAHSE